MKEDDVTIVMYKIMSYLYKCKKEGIEPRESGYNAEKLQINKAYWEDVMRYMQDKKFLTFKSKTPRTWAEITVKGMLWCDARRWQIESQKRGWGEPCHID